MQSDDVIWEVINNGFCAFKVRASPSTFCRHPNNVTGQCNKQSCPLANSRYATIREIEGKCFLYKKVVERAHMPSKMWEKIRIKGSLEDAEKKIEKELEYMPQFLKAKCKARYARIQEYLRRSEKLANDPNQPLLSVKKSKVVKRERGREARAKKVALIETQIEKELLERLKNGVYGDIYNLPQKTFDTVLNQHGQKDIMEEEEEEEDEEQLEYVVEEEDEDEDEVEYEQDFVMSENEQVGDLEDIIPPQPMKKKKAKVEIEYEFEDTADTIENK